MFDIPVFPNTGMFFCLQIPINNVIIHATTFRRCEMLKTIVHDVDFCVVGGGLAGMCAAIAAAREGKTVALVHERPMPGGNASSEIRMWVCGAQGENNRETGIIEEINLESLYRNPYKNYSIWDSILYGKLKAEKNIELLLNTSACDVDMEGGRIKTVVAWQMTTQTWHQINAKFFADCSGDSILAPLTHAQYRVGREACEEFNEKTSVKVADKQTMGLSCLIQARQTDEDIEFIAPEWATEISDAELELRMPHMEHPAENFWYLELGGTGDSIADTEKTRDELVALAYGFWNKYKNSGKFPEASKWQLEFLGFLPGKRESRRMVGAYTLTQSDVIDGGHFDDNVAYGGWGLDDHDPRGFYHAGAPNVWGDTKGIYGIPYRCLYSANVENLFFAGRNISTTHAALSSTRVMMTCAVLGQAVGTAASLAVDYNTDPQGVHDFYIEELQQKLLRADCFIPYLVREVGKPTKQATLSGGENAEKLSNGIDRNNPLYGKDDNGVTVGLGEKVTYTFSEPAYVEVAHIVFDSDLDRLTLPGDWYETYHSMRCNILRDSPKMCVPKTLVKSFSLEITYSDGKTEVKHFENNIRRMNEIVIDACIKSISLVPQTTWGTENAHIFSFDLY